MSDANNSLNPNTAAAATDPWADASAAPASTDSPASAASTSADPWATAATPAPDAPADPRVPPAAVMLQAVTGWAPRPARAFPKTPMPASGTN